MESSISEIIGVFGLFLAAISLLLLFVTEWKRRPSLEFVPHKDEPTHENQRGYMWYHLKIKNKEDKFFNRDAALQCIATVDFLDKITKKPLVSQIQAHWTNQPEPRDYTGRFDYTKVPMCQRMDVGFREEMFDVLIKFEEETGFYATDPWIIYQWVGGTYTKESPEMQKMMINTSECIIRVELESINLGRRKVSYFNLRNKGTQMYNIEILPLESIEKK